MLFDLSYGLRKARQNIKQWLLLSISLSTVVVVLVLVLAIGEYVLKDRPDWVDSARHLYTLGKHSDNGELMPVSLAERDISRRANLVEQAGSLSFNQRVLDLPASNQALPVNLVFFDQQMKDLLSRTTKMTFQGSDEQAKVWVSEHFWRSYKTQLPAIGESLYFTDHAHGFILAGILPTELDRVGIRSVDFWLDQRFFKSLFTLKLQLPPGMAEADLQHIVDKAKDSAIKRIENRFVVLAAAEGFVQDNFLSYLSDTAKTETDSAREQVIIVGGGRDYRLVPGVQFAPQVQQKLSKQWWILLFFLVGLSVICFLNVMTFVSTQLVQRQQELTLRAVLGSSLHAMLRQFSFEALPMLLLSCLLSVSVLFGIYYFTANSDALLAVLGVPLPAPSIVAMILASMILLIFAFSAFLLPCVSVYQQQLFSRQQGQGESKGQARFQQVISAVQMTVAGLTLMLACQYIHQQWQQREIKGFDATVIEYPSNTSALSLITKARSEQLVQRYPMSAFASTRFIDPKGTFADIEVSGAGSMTTVRSQWMSVSSNYFSVLKANYQQYGPLNEQSVIINQAAVKAFGLSDNTPLSQYRLSVDNQRFVISGVVEDLPHYGQHNRHVPMVYTLYQGKTPTVSGYLLTRNAIATSEQDDQVGLSRGTLGLQLTHYDSKRLWFIYLSLGLLLFLFVVTVTAMSFHTMARLKKQDILVGTFLAMGISDSALLKICIRFLMMPLLSAMVSLFIAVLMISVNHPQAILVLSYGGISAFLLVVITLALAFRGYCRLLKQPISQLLGAMP